MNEQSSLYYPNINNSLEKCVIGDMGRMMGSGKMTHEEMENMSKMIGDTSGMMKQMSERMRQGIKKTQ